MDYNWSDLDIEFMDPKAEFRTSAMERFSPEGTFENTWWPALIELEDERDLEELANAREDADDLIVPEIYDEADRRRKGAAFTIFVRRSFITDMNRRNDTIRRLVLGAPVPNTSRHTQITGARYQMPKGVAASWSGSAVTMAVIDNGIAFAHELFRKECPTRSRVLSAWIMDVRADPMTGGIDLGVFLDGSQIEALLARCTEDGQFDEDKFYSLAGMLDFRTGSFKPTALRTSHGTHVMGIAAGYKPGEKDDERPIVCVSLPTYVVADTSPSGLEPYLWLALDYVMKQSKSVIDRDKVARPLVINFSYGNFAGPHDGTGLVERSIDLKLYGESKDRIVRAVLPAGNGNLSRTRARVAFSNVATPTSNGGHTQKLFWRILPDDRTSNSLFLWLPFRKEGVPLAEVCVTAPGGQTSPVLGSSRESDRSAEFTLSGGRDVIATLTYVYVDYPTSRGLFQIDIVPTASDAEVEPLAPSGVWTVAIANGDLAPDEAIEAWIERDERLPGFRPFGRQSYFDHPDYRRYDDEGRPLPIDPRSATGRGGHGSGCVVQRAGTQSGFACGQLPIVAAGLVYCDGKIADYSSAGPISPNPNARLPGSSEPERRGPDAALATDESAVLSGVLSAGSHCGSMVAMNGTSVASPCAARWVADELSSGRAGDRAAIQYAAAGQDRGYPPPRPGETRAGGGRMTFRSGIGTERRPIGG
jgi:hypothetical protein